MVKNTTLKKQMVDFTRFSKQLSEVFPSFQLSEKVREFIRETKESESLHHIYLHYYLF